MSGPPTTRSIRTIKTKRGIPYQARASWEQSDRSSRVSHATEGEPGKASVQGEGSQAAGEEQGKWKGREMHQSFLYS